MFLSKTVSFEWPPPWQKPPGRTRMEWCHRASFAVMGWRGACGRCLRVLMVETWLHLQGILGNTRDLPPRADLVITKRLLAQAIDQVMGHTLAELAGRTCEQKPHSHKSIPTGSSAECVVGRARHLNMACPTDRHMLSRRRRQRSDHTIGDGRRGIRSRARNRRRSMRCRLYPVRRADCP